MYDQELKKEILKLLEMESFREVSEQFNISCSTLYRWQKSKDTSKLIRKFISEERYDEAIELAKGYPNNKIIQSQLMTSYMKLGEYEKAKELARKFPTNERIQSQLMTIYIKTGEYEKAKELARNFLNNKIIQNQLITIMANYVKIEEYEKAIELAKSYPNDKIIQSQLMTSYMKLGEYEKAKEIARNFPNNERIQSQLMTIYIKTEEYEKAIELARNFPNNKIIQNQLITIMAIYVKTEEYEKAKELARNFPNNRIIQNQLMIIYVKTKEYEKAKELARNFPNNEKNQSQLITIYIRSGEYDKAIKIAKKFPNNEKIQEQLRKFYTEEDYYNDKIEKLERKSSADEFQNNQKEFPKEIIKIRSKISLGNVSVKDLDILDDFKEQIGLEKYLLIKLAVCEKLGLLNMATKLLKQDTVLDDKLKKQLISQFARKNRFYNLEKWDSLIDWFSELELEKDEVENCLADSDIKITENASLPVKNNDVYKNLEIRESKKQNSSKKNRRVIEITSSKTKLDKDKQKSQKINKIKTLDEMLNQTYKEMILKLKIKYYIEMYNEETKKAAMYKYDRLEDILSSEPSIKNFELLLLMLVGDGGNSLGIEQSIPDKYSDEYTKVLRKINSRSHRKY